MPFFVLQENVYISRKTPRNMLSRFPYMIEMLIKLIIEEIFSYKSKLFLKIINKKNLNSKTIIIMKIEKHNLKPLEMNPKLTFLLSSHCS